MFRAAYGVYYAQTPTIFFPQGGGSKSTTLFCNPSFFCAPGVPAVESNAPYLFSPSAIPIGVNDLCAESGVTPGIPAIGCPGISYVDPSFRNPRVQNLTVGC